jgi:hypothetical protein
MPRAVLFLCLLSAGAAAQRSELVALLRDPSGRPVVGARGAVRVRPGAALPALGDLMPAPLDRDAPGGEGTSDERGVLRFVAPAAAAPPGAAAGMVWTEDGLGALVVDLLAGRAQRIELQPMAELTTADTRQAITVRARAHLPGGGTVLLLPLVGTSVRLPAGDYELWMQRGDSWIWQRRRLDSGQRTVVAFDGPTLRLAPDAATWWVQPAGRPDVVLATGARGGTLHGGAVAAPLLAVRAGVVWGPAVPTADPRDGSWHGPPGDARPTTRVQVALPADDAGTVRLYSLWRSDGGDWRPLAVATPPRSRAASQRHEPWCELPPPPDGDAWLLLVADGFAPLARPWAGHATAAPLPLQRGVPLAVLCRGEDGLPLVDVAVDYVPDGMTPAAVAAATDAYGVARLGPVLAPGRLRISDARYANQSLELATIPVAPLAVTVAPGAILHGVTRWPDGSPAAGVVVTLRDAAGALRPAERATVSGADGAFAFAGLAAERNLVLFAAAHRDGRTWSGRRERLRPASGAIELVLLDEDPRLAPR